jgi:signal peptidase II
MPESGRRRLRWVSCALALVVVALDQVTKQIAEAHLLYATAVPVTSWFDWLLVYNRGAAFSFLADAPGWQRWFLTAIAAMVSGIVTVWIFRLSAAQKRLALALALILGGGLGNLIDRVLLGYVIDFISWHYEQWYWPAFNVADAAITAGALLLLLDSVLGSQSAQQEVKPTP